MSQSTRPVYETTISCDQLGCTHTITYAPCNGTSITQGWTLLEQRTGLDYCPQHKPAPEHPTPWSLDGTDPNGVRVLDADRILVAYLYLDLPLAQRIVDAVNKAEQPE